MMQISVLGCGNMACAIVKGMARSFDLQFFTYTPSFKKAELLAQAVHGVAVKKMHELPPSDLYLIACKPQQFKELAFELAPLLKEESLVLSIMAGVSLQKIQHSLGVSKVIRAMPNTPMLVGAGVNAFYFSKKISPTENAHILELFSAFSEVFIFEKEDQIDRITPVSGSGPAYLFEMARILIQKLESMGISNASAKAMVTETLYGAAKLLKESEDSAETLRNRVTSSKGVTFNALEVLKEYQLEAAFGDAIDSAYKRARELSQSE